MDNKSKTMLADEIRQIVKSLNNKITEAHRHQIIVVVSHEKGIYSRLSSKPEPVSVEIREENIL